MITPGSSPIMELKFHSGRIIVLSAETNTRPFPDSSIYGGEKPPVFLDSNTPTPWCSNQESSKICMKIVLTEKPPVH